MSETLIPPAKKRRKSKGLSPTARTLAECRKRGWIAQVVEQTIPRVFIKRDLFGCIDIVAIDAVTDPHYPRIIGIQATSGNDSGAHAARRRKILLEPRIKLWIEAGCRMEVWSFSKMGAAGKAKRWTLRAEQIRAEDFVA